MAQKHKLIIPRNNKDYRSTNPNDFILHSDFPTIKIVNKGKLTSQSVTGNPTTIQQAHGQSYIPAVYAFIKYPDGYVASANGGQRSETDPANRYCWVEVDSTYIYFLMYKGSSANYSVDIAWYVFDTPL